MADPNRVTAPSDAAAAENLAVASFVGTGGSSSSTSVATAVGASLGAAPRASTRSAAGDSIGSAAPIAVNPDDHVEFRPDFERFNVKVHRATNISYGMLNYHYCQVRVVLGRHMRESPAGKAFGTEPVFDFSTSLRYKGVHPFIVFEIVDGFYNRQGVAFLPIADFSESNLIIRKALPLWRAGMTYEGVLGEDPPLGNTGFRLAELFVEVQAVPNTEVALSHALNHRLNRARRQCRQIRVTIHCMRLNLAGTKLNVQNMRPYVKVLLGLQDAQTVLANKFADGDPQDYVYVDPFNKAFDAGGLLMGRGEKYGPQPEKSNLQAYRKTRDADHDGHPVVTVDYKNNRMLFWYNLVDALEFEVLDLVSPIALPECLGDFMIDIDDLLLRVYGEGEDFPDYVSSGRVREPLESRVLGAAELGEIEFEVEFFQTPLAKPDQFENLFRTLAHKVKNERQEQVASDALSSALRSSNLGNVLQNLTLDMKISLADAFAAAAITKGRAGLRCEEDADRTKARILRAITAVAGVLSVGGDQEKRLEAIVESMTLLFSLDAMVLFYQRSCVTYGIHPLTPLLAVAHQLFHRRRAYGATLRTALEELACSVELEKHARGARVFGMLEDSIYAIREKGRTTSAPAATSSPASLQSDIGAVSKGLLTVRETVNAARVIEEGEGAATDQERNQNRRLAIQMSKQTLPLPSVDCSTQPYHPADVVKLADDVSPVLPVAGALGMGFLTGTAYAFAIGVTARFLWKVEDNFLCNLAEHPRFAATCAFLHRSGVFDISDFLASKKGATTFFAIFSSITTATTYWQLCDRWRANQELVVEPINGISTSPHLVICISGFLVSHADIWTPWSLWLGFQRFGRRHAWRPPSQSRLIDPDYPWTDGQVCCLRYATEQLLKIGGALTHTLSQRAQDTLNALMILLALSNPVSLSQQILSMISLELSDMIDLAILRAEQAGRQLANYLLDYQQRLDVVRPVSLCAFSVGCVVVNSCLQELERQSTSSSDPERALLATDMICDVFMVGGFVPVGKRDKWASIRQLVSGRFMVGHVPTDIIIRGHGYKRAAEYIGGEHGCVKAPGVLNINLHSLVRRHVQYLRQMPLVLKHYMPLKRGIDAFL